MSLKDYLMVVELIDYQVHIISHLNNKVPRALVWQEWKNIHVHQKAAA